MEFFCKGCEEKGYANPHHFTINAQDLDWDVVEINERKMGSEKTHQANWEDTCPQCGALVSAQFLTWENPEGGFNQDDAHYSGIAPVNPNERIQRDVSFREALGEDNC